MENGRYEYPTSRKVLIAIGLNFWLNLSQKFELSTDNIEEIRSVWKWNLPLHYTFKLPIHLHKNTPNPLHPPGAKSESDGYTKKKSVNYFLTYEWSKPEICWLQVCTDWVWPGDKPLKFIKKYPFSGHRSVNINLFRVLNVKSRLDSVPNIFDATTRKPIDLSNIEDGNKDKEPPNWYVYHKSKSVIYSLVVPYRTFDWEHYQYDIPLFDVIKDEFNIPDETSPDEVPAPLPAKDSSTQNETNQSKMPNPNGTLKKSPEDTKPPAKENFQVTHAEHFVQDPNRYKNHNILYRKSVWMALLTPCFLNTQMAKVFFDLFLK